MQESNNLIKIHPRVQGRITDQDLEPRLRSTGPLSLLRARKLLTTTAKYVKKSGWFSSESSRLINVQKKYYLLLQALKEERVIQTQNFEDSKIESIKYLSMISDTYPNWQAEYEALNSLIKKF